MLSLRWAGQFSTLLLFLNACTIIVLIHYWPSQNLPGSRPGFCNVCGPEDVFCHKYGLHLLARSRGFEGANARFHRVLRDAQAGKAMKTGGSVTVGRGVVESEQWLQVFGAWWKSQFTGELQIQNGAVPATGAGHFGMCFKEHIDEDVDLIITEFAINDQRVEESAESYELLLRQLLELPKRPAVLNLQDLHTAIAEYYDSPMISLRNALLPQLEASRASFKTFFVNNPDGSIDALHINAKGHRMAGELLAAYTQRQICAMTRQATFASEHLFGNSEASQLLLDLDKIPSHLLFSSINDPPAQVLDPYCSSTRTSRHPLIPEFNDGRWSNCPVLVRGGGMGRVRMRYLRSKQYGLGIARCWLDDDTSHEFKVDGYWGYPMSIAVSAVLARNASISEHMLWCDMTSQTSSPDGRTEFRFIGVHSA
ncbi:hypothetical protein BKA62DRAFT_790481 [Auriculariales sp. MPI-PUGE-AT-0066]|nr:hypothetical protein BKA62DRAFT_790481 [Auriculariales sp. MPI-PUGE-AT-0066]